MQIFSARHVETHSQPDRGLASIVTRFAITAVAVFLAVTIIPGIEAHTFMAGVASILVLTLLNTFLRPVLYFLSFPLIIFSFGLFMVVINALLLQLTAYLVKGFTVEGFWPSIAGALLISVVTTALNFWMLSAHTRVTFHESPRRPPHIINPD